MGCLLPGILFNRFLSGKTYLEREILGLAYFSRILCRLLFFLGPSESVVVPELVAGASRPFRVIIRSIEGDTVDTLPEPLLVILAGGSNTSSVAISNLDCGVPCCSVSLDLLVFLIFGGGSLGSSTASTISKLPLNILIFNGIRFGKYAAWLMTREAEDDGPVSSILMGPAGA